MQKTKLYYLRQMWGSSVCYAQWLKLKYVNMCNCSVDQGGQSWKVHFRWAIADRPTRTGLVMIQVHCKFDRKKSSCLEDVGWTNTEDLRVPSLCSWCWAELDPNCLPNKHSGLWWWATTPTLVAQSSAVQKIWMSHLLRIWNLYCELDLEESNQTFLQAAQVHGNVCHTMFGCK